jgi:hypothetical protein
MVRTGNRIERGSKRKMIGGREESNTILYNKPIMAINKPDSLQKSFIQNPTIENKPVAKGSINIQKPAPQTVAKGQESSQIVTGTITNNGIELQSLFGNYGFYTYIDDDNKFVFKSVNTEEELGEFNKIYTFSRINNNITMNNPVQSLSVNSSGGKIKTRKSNATKKNRIKMKHKRRHTLRKKNN